MPQYLYNTRYLSRRGSIVGLILGLVWVASIFITGHLATPTVLLGIGYFAFEYLLCASTMYWSTTRTGPDGTMVKVRRPLIGFKRLETVVEDEKFGMDDGWRYEPARIRI